MVDSKENYIFDLGVKGLTGFDLSHDKICFGECLFWNNIDHGSKLYAFVMK